MVEIKFGDTVKINDGFYNGQTGVVVDVLYQSWLSGYNTHYRIKLNSNMIDKTIDIDEDYLEIF